MPQQNYQGKFEFLLKEPSKTANFGYAIGQASVPGDIVYLHGNLGAGKTTLTKAIASELGIPAISVTSPTFTMVHEYRGGRLPIYHFDLYRLKSAEELYNLGFDDYVSAGDGLIIVEWAAQAENSLPTDALSVTMQIDHHNPLSRWISLTSSGERSDVMLSDTMRLFRC